MSTNDPPKPSREEEDELLEEQGQESFPSSDPPATEGDARPLLAACCAAGVAYVAYMFGIDVPMYWARWVSDEANGRQ